MSKFIDTTNDTLVDMVGQTVIGTPSGVRAQEAQAELTKRLIENISSLDKNTAFYSKWLIALTVLIATLTLVTLFK